MIARCVLLDEVVLMLLAQALHCSPFAMNVVIYGAGCIGTYFGI